MKHGGLSRGVPFAQFLFFQGRAFLALEGTLTFRSYFFRITGELLWEGAIKLCFRDRVPQCQHSGCNPKPLLQRLSLTELRKWKRNFNKVPQTHTNVRKRPHAHAHTHRLYIKNQNLSFAPTCHPRSRKLTYSSCFLQACFCSLVL